MSDFNSSNKKAIYVVFLETPFKIGKFIRMVTKYNYNHASLSFSENPDILYSFARYNKNSPFVGGFVEESPLRYIKDVNKKTIVKIFKIELEDTYYNSVKEYVELLKLNKDDYIYNLFSAMCYPFHREIKIKNAFICIEFILNILKIANVIPQDYKRKFSFKALSKELEKNKIYEGDIKEIISSTPYLQDKFFEKISRKRVFIDTIKSIYTLSSRLIVN